MQHKPNFVMQRVADLNVVVPVNEATAEFNGMLMFNDTGALLWNALETDRTEAELVQLLRAEYAVDEQTAQNDVHRFLDRMREQDLLHE